MIKYGLEEINIEFGINRFPSECLTPFPQENYTNDIFNEIAKLFT